MTKKSFDIDVAMERVETAVQPYPKAALFELADEGFSSPFEQLLACIVSIRTRDEQTLEIMRAFFERARTPEQVLSLSEQELEQLIGASSFSERKAGQIRDIARRLVEQHDGDLPCDRDLLLSFSGVGPKCANLTLAIGCGEAYISVDVHVHRITNRWGYVATTSPTQTMAALEEKLPPRYWVAINRLLVPFGKHICTGYRPHCSTCPLLEMCQQVGVTKHR